MINIASFQSQLDQLPVQFAADSNLFGEGVRLLFSCGSRNIARALTEAEARGIDARGVGRMHILIEVENTVPDAAWVASKGSAIADYFEKIDGTNPQISVDRNFS